MKHPTIFETIARAADLHAGQFDKAGVPYISHPLAVMRRVEEPARHVAVLHDVMEDCGVTALLLLDLGYTIDEVAAIVALTRGRAEDLFCGRCLHEHAAGADRPCLVINCECDEARDETYAEFIERIATSGNRLAIEVKMADLMDNLDPSRRADPDPARELRYRTAYARLLEVC